ncbi:bifunctional phosphoribosyl-AMP cyclohydrolase/phosphoribosyl-ATP diphosphatase HisIE [candidate division KSB3 bacterium]|uniref:Histidine biosynthesis bifunctional protein HisIE n=1 Tax=candidate division KSB3 bacterium TaxID=2044937 RepID=A0A9D5JWQ5_9BACT|nr:bifunctional phosphoribosyl-AMP cyclohydrolase/phosphoribosyl-ATP diphosphatase HisIE [candidate division KSB3 bacterium]MBD3325533.1 bifunctional phosphoribosyl-AMP cyclohydrolase/phosphoribosyl-ATP diphosphatase HisIE [candidate division KSB3 bacterium]
MVIASIDIMQGKVVQLKQGQEKVLERDDPVALAREFDMYGEVAVIDLDAAMGKGDNLALIKKVLQHADCRVGGGIRSVENAKDLIAWGAKKVIIGSQAFEQNTIHHQFLRDLVAQVGRQHIMIAVDSLHGKIVTRGWKHHTDIPLLEAVEALEPYASELLFTCVEREGTMQGTDLAMVRQLTQATSTNIVVAGGVATLEELKELAALGVDVQLGMALYTGKIDLTKAFVECLNWKTDLLPTITQDDTGQVLMLAYSNKDSLRKTFASKQMTYFSRSRNALWTKGETSGHLQDFIRLRPDCDRDALLATVRQRGVACHTGSYSCFGDKRFSVQQLYAVIQDRLRTNDPESYTATLTNELVREKLMEEAQEVVEAQARDEIVWEAADLLYFLTVLLAKSDVTFPDVLSELARRRKR